MIFASNKIVVCCRGRGLLSACEAVCICLIGNHSDDFEVGHSWDASMRACKFEPLPEIKTVIFVAGRYACC